MVSVLSFIRSCFFQRTARTCRATVAEKSAECDLQLQLMSFVTTIFADSAQAFIFDQTARDAHVPVLVVEMISCRGIRANISAISFFDLFRD
jgi:hypothetical protein